MRDINLRPPIYDPEAVQPMRDELVYVGFEELTTPQKIEDFFAALKDETVLVVINSVCGCAAGSARPGITHAVQYDKIPDKLATIFAGQDRDAAEYFRENYLGDYPPSSPSMALLRNREVLHFMPRHHIEGRTPEEVAQMWEEIFDEFCSKNGPSISPEAYAKLVHARQCGSTIPLNEDQ